MEFPLNRARKISKKIIQKNGGMIVERNSNKPVPLEIQALNRQAMEISSHGNYPGALTLFSQIVFIAPHFAKAQYEMGRCLERLGRYKEAVERYDKALRLDPLLFRVDR